MSEVSETEIKSMTKEQNYMRGYEDGKSDVLDKIRAEIEEKYEKYKYLFDTDFMGTKDLEWVLSVIDKYRNEVSE